MTDSLGAGADAGAVDGRRERSVRNKDAVVDALLELLRDGEVRPGGQAIADRAGVSLRTVFRHFDDLDTLMEAAVQRQLARVGPMFELPTPDRGSPLSERVDALARHREQLYEEVAPVRRAAMRLAPFNGAVSDALAASRRTLRRSLERQFQPELATLPATTRRTVLDAADAATSFPAWNAMRADQGLSASRARAAVTLTLTHLFSEVSRGS
jgi:AcrR family transcriptional regulator